MAVLQVLVVPRAANIQGDAPSRFQSLQQLSAAKLLEFFELRFTQVGEGQSLRRARVCTTISGWTMTTTNMAQ